MYTPGIYLTDSPEVATDYTRKDSTEVIYRDKSAPDVRTLVVHYLGHLLATRTDWAAAASTLKTAWSRKLNDTLYADRSLAGEQFETLRQSIENDFQAAMTKARRHHLTKAKAIFKAEAGDLRVVRDTTGEWALVKSDRDAYVSRFDVPESYLSRTLHAERAMPRRVLRAIRDLWFASLIANGHADPATLRIDMRDANGEFCRFDDWVKAYQTAGVDFAWRDDDRIVGGRGELPDLESLWHGTHYGESWFHDVNNMAAFIRAMQDLGYVGLEYDGGKRVGSYVKGGGGVRHRAFVFWDDTKINRLRIGTEKVTEPEGVAGLEKGARDSTRLRRIVADLTAS